MDILTDWNKISKLFNKSFCSNFYVSVASVYSENSPTVTLLANFFSMMIKLVFTFKNPLQNYQKTLITILKYAYLVLIMDGFFGLKLF